MAKTKAQKRGRMRVAPRRGPAPSRVAVARPVKAAFSAPYHATGNELLFARAVPTGSVPAYLYAADLNAEIGARMTRLSPLFEYYRIHSLKFTFVLAGPLTDSCQIVAGVDPDPNDDAPPISVEGCAAILTNPCHCTMTLNDGVPHVMTFKVSGVRDDLFTSYEEGGDYRFSYCGAVYVYALVPPSAAGVTLSCTVSYDITLHTPAQDLPTSAGYGVEAHTSHPDSTAKLGWNLTSEIVRYIARQCSGADAVFDTTTQAWCLQLRPGTYLVDQKMWSTSPTGSVGFTTPSVVDLNATTATVATVVAQYYPTVANAVANHLTKIVVAVGQIARVFGNLYSNYTESGTCNMVLSLANLSR